MDPAACTAFCLAEKFDLSALRQDEKEAIFFRETLYISLPSKELELFLFPYGSVVVWANHGAPPEDVIPFLTPYLQKPIENIETDYFDYSFGSHGKIHSDHIYLPDHTPLTRLAFSHALAQSVKLAAFEAQMQRTFKMTESLPESLALKGRIPLSRSEMRKLLGKLFLERSSINLKLDLLDTPEFFWEHPELEPYYSLASGYLDIKPRVQALNQRLDVLHELFDMLNSELNHTYSSMLEWTIIALIMIEVALTVTFDILHLF